MFHNRLLAAIIAASAAAASATTPLYLDPGASPAERAADLTAALTTEEKIDLLSGYNDFFIHPIERLGIPAFKMADGPLGIASWGLFGRAVAFPSSLSLASSWNRDLAETTADAFADEWRSRGIHLMLAPGVNIYRNSRGARNFEYFGEDPYLTAEMAGAFASRVQQRGVLPVVKHMAGNDQEFDRYSVSTEADIRTLREIYMLPFEELITRHGVQAVMSGYNLLNGVHCSESPLIDSLLHKVWHFDGMHTRLARPWRRHGDGIKLIPHAAAATPPPRRRHHNRLSDRHEGAPYTNPMFSDGIFRPPAARRQHTCL